MEDFLEVDFVRSSGELICEICGKTYYKHPLAEDIRGWQDQPFLNRLCNGKLVKL